MRQLVIVTGAAALVVALVVALVQAGDPPPVYSTAVAMRCYAAAPCASVLDFGMQSCEWRKCSDNRPYWHDATTGVDNPMAYAPDGGTCITCPVGPTGPTGPAGLGWTSSADVGHCPCGGYDLTSTAACSGLGDPPCSTTPGCTWTSGAGGGCSATVLVICNGTGKNDMGC